MKKFIFFTISVLFLSSVRDVPAQNVSREQFSIAFATYLNRYEEYVSLHEKYVLSKKQYEQYKTLSSKENLQKDLKNMLVKRDEVVTYYLRAVISKTDDSTITMPEERKSEFVNLLTNEITWINEHALLYKENDSPQTLAAKSLEMRTRYVAFQPTVYKNLYYITRGKVETYIGRYNFLYNELYSLSEKIKTEQRDAYKLSDTKVDTIYRWFGEIGLKSEEFNKLVTSADTQIAAMKDNNGKSVYVNSASTLNSAMVVFKDRLLKTKEIVNEIKVSEN